MNDLKPCPGCNKTENLREVSNGDKICCCICTITMPKGLWNHRLIENALHGKIDEMDDVIANQGHDRDALQAENVELWRIVYNFGGNVGIGEPCWSDIEEHIHELLAKKYGQEIKEIPIDLIGEPFITADRRNLEEARAENDRLKELSIKIREICENDSPYDEMVVDILGILEQAFKEATND